MTTKAMKINTKVLERTQKSMDNESTYYLTKSDERQNNRAKVQQYEANMKEKSDSYAQWWIYEKGDRARTILEQYHDENVTKDPLYVNVYNKANKGMEKSCLKELVTYMFEKGKTENRHGNCLGQTRIWEDLYVATEIYNFLATYWSLLGVSSIS